METQTVADDTTAECQSTEQQLNDSTGDEKGNNNQSPHSILPLVSMILALVYVIMKADVEPIFAIKCKCVRV